MFFPLFFLLLCVQPQSSLAASTTEDHPLLPTTYAGDQKKEPPRNDGPTSCCPKRKRPKKERTPLTVALVTGDRMDHTSPGWEFLALKDETVEEVGQVMKANSVSLFIEGEEQPLHPSTFLKDLDPNTPLFAVPDEEAQGKLWRLRYLSKKEATERRKRERAERRRRCRQQCCVTLRSSECRFFTLTGSGTLAWFVTGVVIVVDAYQRYESGELEGNCPLTHLYEACLTELAFAVFGAILVAANTTMKCNHLVNWHVFKGARLKGVR